MDYGFKESFLDRDFLELTFKLRTELDFLLAPFLVDFADFFVLGAAFEAVFDFGFGAYFLAIFLVTLAEGFFWLAVVFLKTSFLAFGIEILLRNIWNKF